ncbi:MAG: recombinase family protein [Deltaproteobacteria bacterium]|nr:recombinase family protein [Deltaproteobacteria bacterium]
MRVGIYARVSTTDKGQTPEPQLAPLREYAKARGWEMQEYVDVGESGAKDRRPALDRLLDDARKRRLDGVLVWKLDRLGRSLKHLLALFEEFRALGVQFVSYTENLDFATPAGRAMASLLGVFAEFERDLIRERVRAGMANARAKGKRPGPRSKFAPEDLWTVGQARGRGMSIRLIAREMKVSPALVHKSLKILAARAPENQGSEEAESTVHG